MKRGRMKNFNVINKVKEMKDKGMSNNDISDLIGISIRMVRYYLRQEVKKEVQRMSLVSCFFNQPEEVQERIADEIGYILPTKNDMTEEKLKEMYIKEKGVTKC